MRQRNLTIEETEELLIPILLNLFDSQVQAQFSGHNKILLGIFPVTQDVYIAASENEEAFINTVNINKEHLERLYERRSESGWFRRYIQYQKDYPLRVLFHLRNNMINPLVQNVIQQLEAEFFLENL